jgi:hypothetical protein
LESLLATEHIQFRGRIEQAVALWNSGDVGTLVSLFSEDVAYCSPLIDDGLSESAWVQGTHELASHLLGLRNRFGALTVADVLVGAGFTNLLLRHDDQLISMLIERDGSHRPRRIIVCHSEANLR